MKLLTFMQLAETKSEITFGEIQQFMQLGDNEVEEFLIDRKFCQSSELLAKRKFCEMGVDKRVHLSATKGRYSVAT